MAHNSSRAHIPDFDLCMCVCLFMCVCVWGGGPSEEENSLLPLTGTKGNERKLQESDEQGDKNIPTISEQ